jgi:hypothetical protein
MEDFDYIDALAKKALSDRTAKPSEDGWNVVEQKMKHQKRKRLLVYIVLFALLTSLSIYIGVLTNTTVEENAVSNKNTEELKTTDFKDNNSTNELNSISSSNSNSDSISTTDSNSSSNSNSISNPNAIVNGTSSTGNNTSGNNVSTSHANQRSTTSNFHGTQKAVNSSTTGINSQWQTSQTNSQNASAISGEAKSSLTNQQSTIIDTTEENFVLKSSGLQVYPWELVEPDKLKGKRKKKQTKKKDEKIYEQLDLMVGFNGFTRPNDYNFIGSYVFELSYTDEKKLKKNYFYKYGGSLQFRNLRFKNDSLSFNRGELSLNLHTGLEKRFGNFGVEAGGYVGYELYSPNNEFFNDGDTNFFEQKINYGLFSILHYKKVGLVFKYEFSPYINYLGDKKFGAFTVGIKYDF